MKATIKIQNLKCSGCAHTILTKLQNLPLIYSIHVNIDESEVSFEYENDENLASVKQTLMKIGYPEVGEANSIGTKAKSYVSCAIGKI